MVVVAAVERIQDRSQDQKVEHHSMEDGAFGVQLPATFRDPKGGIGSPFPSGPHYVAGGGGGG